MKIQSKAVHAGDRKKPIGQIPVTTPIYTAASYVAEGMAELDGLLGGDIAGFSYGRFGNPTVNGLEDLVNEMEGGDSTLACASGMAAIHIALLAALTDRRKHVLCASAIYGATQNLLMNVFSQFEIETTFVDICDLAAVEAALAKDRPGCVLMESVSNPLLRVGAIDRIAALCKAAGAALLIDSTFATPLIVRPLELGANIVVHSATKYLSGHGDVLGGLVTTDAEHSPALRALARSMGPLLGPFESYLVMRGIKTFPLRLERQCQNACWVASWLSQQPSIERVYYTGDPAHPDAATIARLFPAGLTGAMVSFELKNAGRQEVFAFLDKLKMIVKATSLGDVHTMVLYPAIASHRELSPKQRERLGIRDSLVRMSVGIEAVDDILADIEQALS